MSHKLIFLLCLCIYLLFIPQFTYFPIYLFIFPFIYLFLCLFSDFGSLSHFIVQSHTTSMAKNA